MFGVEDAETRAAVRAYVKLMRATRSVSARVEPFLARHGLTATQLGVLETILHTGPKSHRELCRKILTSPGNITDVVDKLAARGLVVRMRDAGDRRQVQVQLTPSGRALIESVFPPHAAGIAAAMAGLDAAETAQLDALLRKLGRAAQHGLDADEPASHLRDRTFDIERSDA
jgi:MarR family 2-MHQ and catechol resistance regulon transcriptional repressor